MAYFTEIIPCPMWVRILFKKDNELLKSKWVVSFFFLAVLYKKERFWTLFSYILKDDGISEKWYLSMTSNYNEGICKKNISETKF